MTKKILITGGAGFIGCHLANHLLKDESNELVLVDNLQRGRLDADFQTIVHHPRVSFLSLDLTKPETYDHLGKGYTHVYHLAAVNGTKFFYEIPHEVLRVNTLSLIYILEWLRKENPTAKLCFTSSNEAYAGGLNAFGKLPIPTPEAVPLVIEDTYNPRWSYAGTKLIGELMVINYAKAYNFPAIIVRPHNFYGPRAGYSHVIPEVFERIDKHEEPFVIFGSDDTRSFCYIEDAVRAMQLLMDSDSTNHQPIHTVHIGTPVETVIADLVETMFTVAGWKPQRIEKQSSPAGSVKRRLPDVSKLKNIADWEPTVTLEDGLRKTYEWYRINPRPTK